MAAKSNHLSKAGSCRWEKQQLLGSSSLQLNFISERQGLTASAEIRVQREPGSSSCDPPELQDPAEQQIEEQLIFWLCWCYYRLFKCAAHMEVNAEQVQKSAVIWKHAGQYFMHLYEEREAISWAKAWQFFKQLKYQSQKNEIRTLHEMVCHTIWKLRKEKKQGKGLIWELSRFVWGKNNSIFLKS